MYNNTLHNVSVTFVCVYIIIVHHMSCTRIILRPCYSYSYCYLVMMSDDAEKERILKSSHCVQLRATPINALEYLSLSLLYSTPYLQGSSPNLTDHGAVNMAIFTPCIAMKINAVYWNRNRKQKHGIPLLN